jgi:RNA polymerase sigma-70 factor (ECF subfamily)
MLEEAARVEALGDDVVEQLLLAAIPDAHRVAAWILRDPVGAEDAVQDGLVLAWNRRRSIRASETVSGWFIRIVVNVCRDELRRQRRRPQLATIEPTMAAAAAGAIESASNAPDRAHEHDDLARAIARLTEDEQVVLGLRFGRDLTVPRIATLTGIREGTVKSRLHYALEHLRAALEAERCAEEQAQDARARARTGAQAKEARR